MFWGEPQLPSKEAQQKRMGVFLGLAIAFAVITIVSIGAWFIHIERQSHPTADLGAVGLILIGMSVLVGIDQAQRLWRAAK